MAFSFITTSAHHKFLHQCRVSFIYNYILVRYLNERLFSCVNYRKVTHSLNQSIFEGRHVKSSRRSIIVVRRSHTTNNIFTSNVYLICMICSVYWIVYSLLSGFYMTDLFQSPVLCIFNSYPAQMVNRSFIYSISIITINRFVTIVYPNKAFFKREAWSPMSSAVQWVVSVFGQCLVSFSPRRLVIVTKSDGKESSIINPNDYLFQAPI